MSTNPKTSVLQIRIAPDQLAKFQLHCDARQYGYSDTVRRMIAGQCQAWDIEAGRAAERQARAVLVPVKTVTVSQAKTKLAKTKKNRRR